MPRSGAPPDGAAQPPPGFASALIAALQEAQAAREAPQPSQQLAEAAWDKLQFDWPVVSRDELAALVGEYASSARRSATTRFLAVLREQAGAPAPDAAAAASSSSSGGNAAASQGAGLLPLYQQLYAVTVLQCLLACLEADEAAAAAQLAAMLPPRATSTPSAEGASALEAAAAAGGGEGQGAALLEHRSSQHEDDDCFCYEPLEAAAAAHVAALPQPAPAAAAAAGTDAAAVTLPDQLAELAGHLSYHCMSDADAWRELRLMQRVAACLVAARRHARFPQLQAAAHALLRLAVDRLVAAPAELDAALPALLDALRIPGGSSGNSPRSSSKQEAAADAAAAELALAAAVGLAGQVASPSARRRLCQEVHTRLLPVAAQQLEAQQVVLARQARASGGSGGTATAQPTAEQLHSVMLPCQLLYFFVLQAPPAVAGGSQLSDALLKGGLLRSLVLLFIQLGGSPGAEPLRCALLLACVAAKSLADWAAAVPGFAAATAAAELQAGGGAALHGALWQLLLEGRGASLAALLAEDAPADKVPALLAALQVMTDVQAVARRPSLWGTDVQASLRRLAAELRQRHGRAAEEEGQGGSGAAAAAGQAAVAAAAAAAPRPAAAEDGSSEVEEEEAAAAAYDARKLALPPEEAAAAAAARRAQALQPACLRLVKGLLQQGAAGKAD